MKNGVILVALAIATCIATLVSGCDGTSPPSSSHSVDQQILNDNVSLWQRSSLSSYQYTYSKMCFCVPEQDIVVIVLNGKVSQAFRTPSGTYLSPQEIGSVFPVEGLFDKVQDAINQNVFSLRVTYNAKLGYPESIAIDGNQKLVDDEITHIAKNLQ